MNAILRSVLDRLGLFVARQFRGRPTGYDLPRDLRVLMQHRSPVCFDVGANQGQTIRMLQRCHDRPFIHAFEPASVTFAQLAKQNYGPSVRLHQLALGEQMGTAEFRNYAHSELNSFLGMNSDRRENVFAEEEMIAVERVRVETLDQFCREQGVDHIDLLKIDTQGFELPVLRGGTSLFQRQKIGAVLLELNFAQLYEGQSDPLVILQFLRTHRMRLVDYYEKERIDGPEIAWTTALFIRHDG